VPYGTLNYFALTDFVGKQNTVRNFKKKKCYEIYVQITYTNELANLDFGGEIYTWKNGRGTER